MTSSFSTRSWSSGFGPDAVSRDALHGGDGARKTGKPWTRKGLLGLSNLGNTCFMNAALQCLAHTHGLQKYFRLCSYAYTSKGQSSRQKLLMAFAHWFERDWGKNVSATYHTPEDILRAVQLINPTFAGYQQQDSQEFLRCVLDCIHEELKWEVPDDLSAHLLQRFGIAPEQSEGLSTSASSRASGSSESSSTKRPPALTAQPFMLCQNTEVATDTEIRLQSPEEARAAAGGAPPAEARKEETKEEPGRKTHFSSIVSELFQCRVVSVVRCLDCGKSSRTTEPMYDVSVPIPTPNEPNGTGDTDSVSSSMSVASLSGLKSLGWLGNFPGKVKSWFVDKGVDVTDCLRKYCATEYLTGKDQYYCEHCKRKNDCEKRIAFRDLPEVLCIHIKRFRYDSGWFNGTKNARVVTFPVTKNLDLSQFLEEELDGTAEYKLVGLIQHIGSMGGGHYISYCQHKRKPGEWYEFDDLQVSPVGPEQVERAEPYVLFYQRVPSRASRRDRLTFKDDHRRTLAQIRSYLLSHSSTAEEADGAAPSSSSSASPEDIVAHEMRHHGPALRNLYRLPPSELDMAFISKHWYARLTTMSNPGPVDNHAYLCPHQLLGTYSSEMAAEPFLPISRSLFQSLAQKYGGGPAIGALEICPKCQMHLRAYNDRKRCEFELVTKYDTKDTGDGVAWYLIDATWVENWKRYVRADHVTDIRDMCAPGPITNHRLLKKDSPEPRPNLRLRSDYIGVNARVWWLFLHMHGGGPPLIREELDMYSATSSAETNLVPDEIRSPGGGDIARRISHEFVDACSGEIELYRQRYGPIESPDAVPPETREPEITRGL